nr:hypothetical protein [Tanacetum cinerariifolium]
MFFKKVPRNEMTKERGGGCTLGGGGIEDEEVAMVDGVFEEAFEALARHSVSSSSTHHYGSLSYHEDEDDDEDDNASCASTPSPTTYLNSFSPLNYQKYDIPTSSQQDDDLLFEHKSLFSIKRKNCMRKLEEVSSHLKRH